MKKSYLQSHGGNCKCDGGWDFRGNPIPKMSTFCGYQVCGLKMQDGRYRLWECGSDNVWGVLGTSCDQKSLPLNTKFGVNSAATYTRNDKYRKKTALLGMGYYLEIATNPRELEWVVVALNRAINNGVIPILRICIDPDVGACGFVDVADYTSFLTNINGRVDGFFYAIAGPNEPLTENWHCRPHCSEGEPSEIAGPTAEYMNSVIKDVSSCSNIKLLSPAFNLTNPGMQELIKNMHKEEDAEFHKLDGIAGNCYNKSDGRISDWVNNCRNVFIENKIEAPLDCFFITEMGAYEIKEGMSRDTALRNLHDEVNRLREKDYVRAALFFDAFKTNSEFSWAVIHDDDWPTVLGTGEFVQCFWRGNQGFARSAPIKADGIPDWGKAGSWSKPIHIANLPGDGDIQCMGVLPLDGGRRLLQALCRSNKLFCRVIPIKADPAVHWIRGGWSEFDIDKLGLEGDGNIQTQSSVLLPNRKLLQGYWRGDKGYYRYVNMIDNCDNYWTGGGWKPKNGMPIGNLKGSGSIRSQSDVVLPNRKLLQGYWRGSQGFYRYVPIKAYGYPDWNNAPDWSIIDISNSGLPGIGNIQAQCGYIVNLPRNPSG